MNFVKKTIDKARANMSMVKIEKDLGYGILFDLLNVDELFLPLFDEVSSFANLHFLGPNNVVLVRIFVQNLTLLRTFFCLTFQCHFKSDFGIWKADGDRLFWLFKSELVWATNSDLDTSFELI